MSSQSHSQSNMTSMVESAINKEQKEKLAAILKHVSRLSDLEKLYLYLKLPAGLPSDETCKRSSVPPPASTSRTTTTLTWIRSHYVEDKNVCVPKQEVYTQYRLYCDAININPVGSADFGKMVKTAFPNIHHRRLGQRGKSKYCYGGLKRKAQIELPTLPVLQTKPIENPAPATNPLQEMQNLSGQLICEWACKLFDKKFMDIKSLAQYLIQSGASYGKKAALFSMMYDSSGTSSRLQETKSSELKLQDTQALLQRKLHQKEVLKEHMNLLKQQQKNQRAATSVSVTPVEMTVGNGNTSHRQQGDAGKCSTNYYSDDTSKLASSIQSESVSVVDTDERPAHSVKESYEVLVENISVSSRGTGANNGSGNVNGQERHFQNRGPKSQVSHCEGGRQPEKRQSSFRGRSSSVNMSSDSDVSRESPQFSLEVDDHKHQKRMGEVLTGSSHERVSKRRRCMTSLGMPHLEMTEDLMSGSESAELVVEPRIRPFSCPTLYDALSLSSNAKYINKSSSKETFTSKKRQSISHWKERENGDGCDKQTSSSKNKELNSKSSSRKGTAVSRTKSDDKSSFHFVQKPTVIAVRHPGTLFPSVMSCPNFTSSQKSEQDSPEDSDIKKTHNILNTLLSSDTDPNSFPKPPLSIQTPLSSTLSQSVHQLNSLDSQVNQQEQKLPHTLDNAYILSSQSNRSAFVPVASNKLQDFSRSRSSQPCLNMYSPSRCSSGERPIIDANHSPHPDNSESITRDLFISSDDETMKDIKQLQEHTAKSSHSPITSGQIYSSNCSMEDTSMDHFKPISYSVSQGNTPVSSVINRQSSVTPTPMVSSSPVSQTKMSTQTLLSNSSSSGLSRQPAKAGSKSPVTPPKRQSRSRFTPIRPKINGCTPSPQKKDMRPVSTILKEQRVRNAQELLLNLANSYQGEVQLQMPAELLGLTAAGKKSDVLVTIGTPGAQASRPVSSLPIVSPNKEIKLLLQPQSQKGSCITPPLSSMPLSSPDVNTPVTNVQLVSNNEMGQQSIPLSHTSTQQTALSVQKNTTDAASSNSQFVIVSSDSSTSTTQVQENSTHGAEFVIADSNGTIYTVDKDSQPFPLPLNMKNILETESSDKSGSNSSSKMTNNVINISDINGQVIGPDDTGQTYLIIPSSEATSEIQTQTSTVIDSSRENSSSGTGTPSVHSSGKGEMSLLPSVLKSSQDSIQTLSSAVGAHSSSSALLSELSQLASASKQEKSQTRIQHDSAVSAFHKCAPNKQQAIPTGTEQGLELYLEEGKSDIVERHVGNDALLIRQFSLPALVKHARSATDVDTSSMKNNASNSHKEHIPSQCQSMRKRKASKSRVMGMKDKKRQNTSERSGKCSEDDDVVIVDMEEESSKREEIILEDSRLKGGKETENRFLIEEESQKAQGKSEIDSLDTDALLQMISGSRSLTVKQTVMAINSLKAEMKKKLQGANEYNSGSQTDWMTIPSQAQEKPEISNKEQLQLPYGHLKGFNKNASTSGTGLRVPGEGSGVDRLISNQTVVDKPRLVPKILRSSRRNMSLNLESLESDALLDNEPTLDHRLVGDVEEGKIRKSENKTSVAVVAKTSQSSSLQRQESSGKKSQGSRSTFTNGADALKFYQSVLKEKKVGGAEGSRKPTELLKASVESSRKSNHSSKSSHTSSSGALSLPRRSVSCVRDILERGTSSSVLDHKKSERLSGVEKSCGAEYFDALLSKMQSKSNEVIGPEGDSKPKSQTNCDLDIPIDVVDFVTESMSSQNMYNFPSTRCVSVPNTRPDFFNIDKSGNTMWTQRLPSLDMSENANAASGENSILVLDGKQGDSFSEKGDDLGGHLDEQVSVGKQNVFLSPVGPAKLARRLSIEKSVAQPPVDRSMSKTPVEILHSRISSESASMKCSVMKGQSVDRQSTRTPVDRALNYTERKRAKTPFDPTMNFQTGDKKGGKQGLTSQTSEELTSAKPPVNRSLTRTPMDKFFHKIVSDSLLSKYQVENLSQQYSRDQNNDEYLTSQTPTSDAGYGSVSETPVSDFGYNSISPSPVMMSSSSFFGECGRRDITSPATIFMPLRSDSALSLNNNVNSEHLICPPQANLSDILPSVSNQFGGDNFTGEPDQNEMTASTTMLSSTNIQDKQSSLSTNSPQGNHLDLQVLMDNQQDSTNPNEISNSMDFSKLVSLHNIPTPPFSPNSALMTSAPTTMSPLQFSIPFSPLPNHDSSPSPPSIPRFLLPCSTNISTNSTISLNLHHSSVSPPRRFGPQDQHSPSVAHVLTPSPHILARPPSSPHQFGTHPSPPFTPSSQRSLPSPCPTPSSFKSLISPRSVTPSVDPSLAPNGFMPIQSSCVQTASLAPTHTYIQPIKPVVTLASPSSHVAGGSESQTYSSSLSLGILSPSVGSQPEDKRHIYGRRTPSVITSSANENVLDTQLQTFNANQQATFRTSTSKAFHSTAANHSSSSVQLNPSGFSYQDNLYLSDSSFTIVPSKLQVDLAKLETSQNPTSTVQSKPFQNRQCKINLDNCDTSASVQAALRGRSTYSSINSSSLMCPNNSALLFDTRKDMCHKASYEDLTSLNAPAVTNVWDERLTKSCQDDLQATLEVLRDMDGQYFPSDEDNSNGGSTS